MCQVFLNACIYTKHKLTLTWPNVNGYPFKPYNNHQK